MVSVVFEAIYQSTKANGSLHTLNQERVCSGAVAHWKSTAQQVFCIKQYVKRFVFCLLSLEIVGKVVVSVKLCNFWGQGHTYSSFLDKSGVKARWGQARVGKMYQDTGVLGKENTNPAEIESVMQCFNETSKKHGYKVCTGSGWYKMHGCLIVPTCCKQGCAHISPHLETWKHRDATDPCTAFPTHHIRLHARAFRSTLTCTDDFEIVCRLPSLLNTITNDTQGIWMGEVICTAFIECRQSEMN